MGPQTKKFARAMIFIGLVDPPSLEKMAGSPSGQLQLSTFFSSCQTDMGPHIKYE